jgi:hypothetical protein
MAALILALFGIVPIQDIDRETVDLVEENYFYDEHAQYVFTQLIFYDWDARNCTMQVRGFHCPVKLAANLPAKDWETGMYYCYLPFGDGSYRWIGRINARNHIVTHTQYDPEIQERVKLPRELRRPLPSLPESQRRARILAR